MATSEKLRFAGDVSIEKVQVVKPSGFFQDIANQVITIQIYEDLFSPFISGSLILKESLDLINVFPFVGEEFLNLEITTPTMKDGGIKGKFYIYKMTDRELVGNRSMVYQLHFISQEAVLDMNKKISRTFGGKVSDIAKTLLTDPTVGIQTKKNVTVEDTSSQTKYISNFWSPVKNLNYILNNAVNQNGSPSYTFFENRQGFNFVSLESLSTAKVYQEFVYDNYTRDDQGGGGSVKNLNKDYQRIAQISIPNGFDYMNRIRDGMYGSKMYTFDITSKKIASKNYNMLENFSKEKHLNANPMASEKVIFRYNSKILNEPKYYNNFSNFADSTNTASVQKRMSLMAQAEANKIEITVPGRTDYTVGQKVLVRLNKMQPISEKDTDTLDNMFSGNYLISAVNHYINRENHECHMELIKDSLLVNLDGKK
jgi:hypothetical protein